MDTFKKALKIALGRGAFRLKFVADQSPVMSAASGNTEPLPDEILSRDEFEQLYTAFFPSEEDQQKIREGLSVQGALNVVNVGEMHLIAEPRAGTLKLFIPPHGTTMFRKTWKKIQDTEPDRGMSSPAFTSPGLASEGTYPNAAMPDLSAPPPPPVEETQAGEDTRTQKPRVPHDLQDAESSLVMSAPPPVPAVAPEPEPAPIPATATATAVAPGPLPAAASTSASMSVAAPPPPGQETVAVSDPPPVVSPMAAGDLFAPAGPPHPAGTAPPPVPPAPPVPATGGDVLASFSPSPADADPVQDMLLNQPVPAPLDDGLMAAVGDTGRGENTDESVISFYDDPSTGGIAPIGTAASRPEAIPDITFGSEIPGMSIPAGDYPVNELLRSMLQNNASDLHLTIGQPPCLRVDGTVLRTAAAPLTPQNMEDYLLPIMPPVNRREFATANDTDFAYELPGIARFRVNVFRDINGVGSVLRQIPAKILTADELGLPEAIRRFCGLSKGLVLVTGPTGSGKSTTLAAMIDLINQSRSDHILTVEDPVEFVHPQKNCLVNQREVHSHTTSFPRALKAALREDPDIVLIGEMRDLETVAIAIETAETGHLVFGTLHTNTAVSTIDRIIDQFPGDGQEQIRIMLAESLKGVVAQTLIRKKGGGRVAAYEILVCSKSTGSQIREKKSHMIPNEMQTRKADGNLLMHESMYELIRNDVVDPHDALAKAADKEEFKEYLSRKGIKI